MVEKKNSHKVLRYSYWLSIICLIHCISFPLIIAILPFIDIVFEINHSIEIAILLSVFIMGSYALIHSYINHHKNKIPLIIFYIGIVLSLITHVYFHEANGFLRIFLEVFSGLLLAIAQYINIKITPITCSH